jgi:hypothetical protein
MCVYDYISLGLLDSLCIFKSNNLEFLLFCFHYILRFYQMQTFASIYVSRGISIQGGTLSEYSIQQHVLCIMINGCMRVKLPSIRAIETFIGTTLMLNFDTYMLPSCRLKHVSESARGRPGATGLFLCPLNQ